MSLNKFAEDYAASGISRLHMPGHKGCKIHGLEPLDLTEIKGADSLFESEGVIAQGERRTAEIFGARTTCWSAEGSSLCIKAALGLAVRHFGRRITVAAPRNCHRAFISACVLLDIDVKWIFPESGSARLCECGAAPEAVEKALAGGGVDAVYITSPDYLGGISDIGGISRVCKKHGALLICDNAHGAYLKFVGEGLHPLDLGADIVCESAHKTLPVYTGGAYLHIAKSAPANFDELAKPAMVLFGSTSPSYLIMGSLDRCTDLLEGDLPKMLRACCERTARTKKLLAERGISDISREAMKITIDAVKLGYTGVQLAEMMRRSKMECEYADAEVVVLMLSPYNPERDFERIESFFSGLELREPLAIPCPPEPLRPEKVMSLRQAELSRAERIDVEKAEGRVCARSAMSCQPSVAAVMGGEKISAEAIKILKRYSILQIDVL